MSDADHVIPFDELPERFAESVENPPAVPVAARPAATIVLLRDAPAGMEVLLMRRNRKAVFVPGAYVFPGGRVDGSDAYDDAVAVLDGLTESDAEERLGLPPEASPPAIAYYMAALREAFEETGIVVGLRPDGSAPPTAAEDSEIDALRCAVMDDEIGFPEVLERLGCRIPAHDVEYLAHWITPEAEHRRYDTRFFAAQVRDGATPIVDPREMTEALWITPAGALARLDDGTLPMVFPTIKTLEQLARYPDADTALSAIGAAPVRTIMPTLVVTPTGVGMRLDSDE